MRDVGALVILLSLVVAIASAPGCGPGSGSTLGTGGSTAHPAATSTTSTTTGSGGASTGSGGASANPFQCTVPAIASSHGSCVAFTAPDGGGELDAGVDDSGDPSVTTCNPVTNAGCTGTDVCGPDLGNTGDTNYFCQPGDSTAAICADCTQVNCGKGTLCVALDNAETMAVCAPMCCTDADCGSAARCNMGALMTPLPSSVGLCTSM